MEWLNDFASSISLNSVLLGVGLFLLTFSVSLGIVALILVKIPATYFKSDHPRELWADQPAILRVSAKIGKNILGVLLVIVGIILSLPGVPGQGILTILLGVMLLDFPGKHRVERRLIGRPKVLNTVNGLRKRFGKPKLVLD